MSTPDDFDKIQRTDHDVLIKLDQKFDSYISENRQINTDITNRFADHESRLRGVEGRIEGFQGAINAFAWLSGIIGAVTGAIVGFLVNIFLGKH